MDTSIAKSLDLFGFPVYTLACPGSWGARWLQELLRSAFRILQYGIF